ncbi:MAG: hypothetical protein IMX03_08135 [Brockia lithotrophica]|nr:hypothetical protein [Brockia lithotrophica]
MSGRAGHARRDGLAAPPQGRVWAIGGRLALAASAVLFSGWLALLALLPQPSREGPWDVLFGVTKSASAPEEAREERIVRLFTSLPLSGRVRHVHEEGTALFVDVGSPPDPRTALGDALALYGAVFAELPVQTLYLRVFVGDTEELYLALRARRPAFLPEDRRARDSFTPADLKSLFGPDVEITFGPRWPGSGG